jgi:Tol biopolymer transport system component
MIRIRASRAVPAAVLLVLGAAAYFLFRGPALPADLSGAIVYVSGRSGVDALYWRKLPRGRERRLTHTSEPVREPALSPDGAEVAFVQGGRIGVVGVGTGEVRMLTLGVEWRDAQPSWRSDGRALAVRARRNGGEGQGLHVLSWEADGKVVRRPVTESRGLDDQSPVFAPDAASLVFVREDNLFKVALADGRTTRLTGGFKRFRAPRFLPSGRIVCLWTAEKEHGLDVLDADGRNRETLWQGAIYYRDLAPSPDGRYLAATFGYDLQFHPIEALRRQGEEIRLLDAGGQPLGVLETGWRHAVHSPDWSRGATALPR